MDGNGSCKARAVDVVRNSTISCAFGGGKSSGYCTMFQDYCAQLSIVICTQFPSEDEGNTGCVSQRNSALQDLYLRSGTPGHWVVEEEIKG